MQGHFGLCSLSRRRDKETIDPYWHIEPNPKQSGKFIVNSTGAHNGLREETWTAVVILWFASYSIVTLESNLSI